MFFDRKKTPRRTPPVSPPVTGLDMAAVDAALRADEEFEQDLFFKWSRLFGGAGFSLEPDPRFKSIINILFRLYYEFNGFGYNNKDAADMALRTFLRYY